MAQPVGVLSGRVTGGGGVGAANGRAHWARGLRGRGQQAKRDVGERSACLGPQGRGQRGVVCGARPAGGEVGRPGVTVVPGGRGTLTPGLELAGWAVWVGGLTLAADREQHRRVALICARIFFAPLTWSPSGASPAWGQLQAFAGLRGLSLEESEELVLQG